MVEEIWVLAELRDGKVRKVSRQVLSEGMRLAEKFGAGLSAVFMGDAPEDVLKETARYADRVYVIRGAPVKDYTPEGYAAALVEIVREKRPRVVLAGATVRVNDFLPRTVALLMAPYAPGCVAMDMDDETITVRRPMYGGKVFATFTLAGEPAFVTVRPNMFAEGPPRGAGEVVRVETTVSGGRKLKTKLIEERSEKAVGVDLTEAEIVVSGGRGMKEPGNFRLIEDFAGALGAAVGASRAVVDAGWRDYADQVGKSGKTVSPKLYFACGISGAVHHILGMDTSKIVVAVNRDPAAPIFGYSDYGIAGDCMEILPQLTKAFREMLQEN